MIESLKRRLRGRDIARELCAAVSRRARDPAFYRYYGVADSVDGRFDLVVLHAWLALERLKETGEDVLAQNFVDALFAHFDEALREQGAGDIGMSRRMKTMAGAFYGRLRAYTESGDQTYLAAAILRNVYRGDSSRVEQSAALAKYVYDAQRSLSDSRLAEGELQFGLMPAP